MSSSTACPNNIPNKTTKENNNTKCNELQKARSFISWYKYMIDIDRAGLSLYFSDDIVLEWFGRTIKTRKKVSAFLKFDIQCSRHDFTSVENIERVIMRNEKLQRKDLNSSSPLKSPEMLDIKRSGKRKLFESRCVSPEWDDGCQPPEDDTKKAKHDIQPFEPQKNGRKRLFPEEEEVNSKGDSKLRRSKRKCVQESTITPPNKEFGQGDCMPSTSGNDSDRSHETLNAQLVKLAVECNGYIEFTRSKNFNNIDSMKWERKCKVQISYSEDPLNVGEYIIWYLRYTDETKCRRNLLAAFEEAELNT